MGYHNTCFIRYYANSIMVCPDDGMVDMRDLKSLDLTVVQVRVLFWVLIKYNKMNKINQPKIMLIPDGIKIRLTKLTERTDAEVPNNIQEGEYRIGYIRNEFLVPKVGKSYVLESVIEVNGKSVHPGHYFYTSQVVDILDWFKDKTFKTLNSIYKVELL